MMIDRITLLVLHPVRGGKLYVQKHQSSMKLKRNLLEIF